MFVTGDGQAAEWAPSPEPGLAVPDEPEVEKQDEGIDQSII